MKRANLGMLLCAIALAGTSSAVVWADDDNQSPSGETAPRAHHRGASGHRDILIREVMTPDQQKKFDAMMQEAGANRKALGEQLKTLSQKAQSGQKLNPEDDKKANDLQEQIKQIRKSSHEKAYAMLTDDQKTKFKKMVNDARQAGQSSGSGADAAPAKAD